VNRVAIPEPILVKEAFNIPRPIVAPVVKEPVLQEPVATTEATVEEPATEENVAEDPVVELPIVSPVTAKEPVVHGGPTIIQPVIEEPAIEQPAVEPVSIPEPSVEEFVFVEPVVEEPVVEEPVVEPVVEELVEEPVVEPVVEEPVVEEPVVEEPVVEPVVEEPVVEEPVVEEPVVEPVVEEPVVEEPVVEEPVVEPVVEEPVVESVVELVDEPVEVEAEVEEAPLFAETPSSPATQLPSPLSRVVSPIPLEFCAEEEAEIKEAIQVAMQEQILETETPEVVAEAEASLGVELDLAALPALPDSPILEATNIETLPLPESPALEDLDVEESEEMAVIDAESTDEELEDEVDVGDVPSTEMARQPSPPSSQPGTPTMDRSDGSMKIVPYMPLTPPETPLGFRTSRERTIEFNLPLPLIMQPAPPPATSILDSPISFRGKDRQVEDSPSHYFAAAPPSPASPSLSLLDSPLASSRRRRIGETIEEEDEDVEETKEVNVPAKVEERSEDYESDVEEIIRSPRAYPSPPSSPMRVIVDAPTKCKELARVPSFTIVCTPSPPPSIRDVPMGEDEDGGVSILRGTSPAFDSSTSKGKEREDITRTLPSPVLEQQEDEAEIEYDRTCRAAWATADDIFLGQPEHYHYSYQYDNRRPLTPASSICSLQRRWSGVSRTSYQTGITTPPASRPGSSLGSNKLIGWNDSDTALRRSDSHTGSIRREQLRDQSRSRKPLLAPAEGSSTETGRPTLRWSMSMPLIREQWAIQTPTILPANDRGFVSAIPDENVEEYDVKIAGTIQLLPATRGVIVTPPRIERRRRIRPQYEMGPHRRKIRSLVQYSPDDQLEGIDQLFGDVHEREEVHDEPKVTEAVEEVKPVVPEISTLRRGGSVLERRSSVLRHLRSRASAPEVDRPHALLRLKSKASTISVDGGAALPVEEKSSLPISKTMMQKAESLNEKKPSILRRMKSRASSSDILSIASSATPTVEKINIAPRSASPAPGSSKERKPSLMHRIRTRASSHELSVPTERKVTPPPVEGEATTTVAVEERSVTPGSDDKAISVASSAQEGYVAPEADNAEVEVIPRVATHVQQTEPVQEKKPNFLRRIGSRASSIHENRLSRHSMHDIIAASPAPAQERISGIPRAATPAPRATTPAPRTTTPVSRAATPAPRAGTPVSQAESLGEKKPNLLSRLKSKASMHEMLAKPTAAPQTVATPPAEEKAVVAPRPVQQEESAKEKKPSMMRRFGSKASNVKDKLKDKVSTSSSTKKLDKGKGKAVA